MKYLLCLLLSLLSGNFSSAATREIILAVMTEKPGVDVDSPIYLKDIPPACEIALDEMRPLLIKAGINVKLDFHEFNYSQLAASNTLSETFKSNAIAAIGFQTSDEVLSSAPVIKDSDFLAVSPNASSPKVLKLSPNYVSLAATNSEISSILSKFILDDLHAKKIVSIVAWDAPFPKDFYESMPEGFQKKSKLFKIWDDMHDFDSIIPSIKSENPDVIFVPNFTANAASIMASLVRAGVKATFVGPDSWGEDTDPRFMKIVGGLDFTAYTIRPFSKHRMDESMLKFESKLKERHSSFSVVAGLYHDATLYALQTILKTKDNLSRKGVLDSAQKNKVVNGAMGRSCVSDPSCTGRNFVLLKINRDGFKFDKKINNRK